jgi:hypothetical protein
LAYFVIATRARITGSSGASEVLSEKIERPVLVYQLAHEFAER